MNYELINMGAYNLHFIKTNRFKTITVEVDFRREIQKNDITKRYNNENNLTEQQNAILRKEVFFND